MCFHKLISVLLPRWVRLLCPVAGSPSAFGHPEQPTSTSTEPSVRIHTLRMRRAVALPKIVLSSSLCQLGRLLMVGGAAASPFLQKPWRSVGEGAMAW